MTVNVVVAPWYCGSVGDLGSYESTVVDLNACYVQGLSAAQVPTCSTCELNSHIVLPIYIIWAS